MKNITAALIIAKKAFPPIYKTSVNPHFKNKYASLDVILEAVTEPLCNAGIVLIQPTIIKDGLTILSTKLIHAESGESIESQLIIPAQSDPQKLGSAMTYYRRFSVCSILAIAAEIDDDGNTATVNSAPKTVNPAIEKAIEAVKDCLNELNYSTEEKKAWGKTINPNPSAQWSLHDWERAVSNLHDRINAEDRSASGFPPEENDGGVEIDRQAYAKLIN
jgi:hypothetical protein